MLKVRISTSADQWTGSVADLGYNAYYQMSSRDVLVKLKVNGETHDVEVDGETPLLWVLRDHLNLTGTKYGCGIAQCGACTVHVRGKPLRSCTTPVASVSQFEITTIEGLAGTWGTGDQGRHPVQQAWVDEDVPQCGYCQSGQIMTAAALISDKGVPTDKEIDQAMTNLCRCGTYPRIRKAIHRAAQEIHRD